MRILLDCFWYQELKKKKRRKIRKGETNNLREKCREFQKVKIDN